MNKEFKKTFLICLLAVLLVISNLISAKYTNLMDVTVGVEFVTLPFTFLCTLLILNYGNKRDAYRGILVASVIQLLITISYAFVVSLGSQTLMPDKSVYVDMIFKVDETKILASVFAFVVSNCTLIYLYESFKEYGKELYGLVIGLLGSMILNSFIYLIISLKGYEPIYIINLLLGNIIISVIMVIIITTLYYILRDKENVVEIKKMENPKNKDLSVEEVVSQNKKVVKENSQKKKNTKTYENKTKNMTKKSREKTTKTKPKKQNVKKSS